MAKAPAQGTLFAALVERAVDIKKTVVHGGTPVERFLKAVDKQIANVTLLKQGQATEGRVWFWERNGKYYTRIGSLTIGGKPTLEVGDAGDHAALIALYELVKSAVRAGEGDLVTQINANSRKVSERLSGTRGPRKPK